MKAINDSKTPVTWVVDGVRVICPYYRKWRGMFDRCYGKRVDEEHPTYSQAIVCPEWQFFSAFREWAISQELLFGSIAGLHLDKDVLLQGNKIYSPDTCCFVSRYVNLFITDSAKKRGKYPLGVCWHKSDGKLRAIINVPDGEGGYKPKHLGHFSDEESAHKAWQKAKFELACNLAAVQTNPAVAEALIKRYTYNTEET